MGKRWQRNEIVLEVKLPRSGLGIDDNGPRCDLTGAFERPFEGVDEKEFSPT